MLETITTLFTLENQIKLVEFAMLTCFLYLGYFLVTKVKAEDTRFIKSSVEELLKKQGEVDYYRIINSNRNVKFEITLLERINFRYIERSNIKEIVPFATIYILVFFCICIFLVSMTFLLPSIRNLISAVILSGIVAIIPLMLLDVRAKAMSERARRDLFSFVSNLRVWSQTKSDLLYIFDKASQDEGPLARYSGHMVAQIRKGLSEQQALELFRMKVNNEYFDTFILNITQAFINQGDIVKLLFKLEREAARLEKAYNDRKIKTLMDRMMVLGLMIGTLAIAIFLLTGNDSVRRVYVDSFAGQVVLSVASVFFALGVALMTRVTKFDH